jgi:L-threonylcarbamoyladenylate synthase
LPVAAPSANLSGKPSPTRGEHVIRDLNGKIPVIIDAGNCSKGIESTVLTFSNGKPMILRPGSVTREMLEEVLLEKVELVSLGAVDKPQAPGMKYRHYAPKAPVTLVEGETKDIVKAINRLVDESDGNGKIVVIGFSDSIIQYHSDIVLDLGPRSQPEVAAARLYDLLRHCDDIDAGCIYRRVSQDRSR